MIVCALYAVLDRGLVVEANVHVRVPRAVSAIETLEESAIHYNVSLSLAAHAVLITSQKEAGEKDPPTRVHGALL